MLCIGCALSILTDVTTYYLGIHITSGNYPLPVSGGSQATAYTCADQGRHRADSTLLEIAEPLLCVAFSSLTCCSAHFGIFRTSNPVS